VTAKERKERPLYSGVLRYFPDALLEVAYASYVGNEQHHPGAPLHWDRSKSTDDAEALGRHLLGLGEVDSDGVRHAAKVAWRALAVLQKELEAERAASEPLVETAVRLGGWKREINEAGVDVTSDLTGHDRGFVTGWSRGEWWSPGPLNTSHRPRTDDEDDGA
jgi:hypothetical protein